MIAALAAAARTLSLGGCRELARLLVEHVVVQTQNHQHALSPLAHRNERAIGSVRAVAELLGHAPTTTEYTAEYKRRRATGDSGLMAVGSITRLLGGWPQALVAAGLIPSVHPSAYQRRVIYERQVVHRYSNQRLSECLLACARDLGRVPMVRDYVAWREDALDKPGPKRTGRSDVPHHRTYYERFGSWDGALDAAGLPAARRHRTETTTYSDLA